MSNINMDKFIEVVEDLIHPTQPHS